MPRIHPSLRLVAAVGAALLALSVLGAALALDQPDLAGTRAATARFHSPDAARAAGWAPIPGLDYCFDNPGVGGMGFHYINQALLNNTTLDPNAPEALVYAPGPHGQLQLVAVEWIVPAALWDAAHPAELPNLLGKDLHLEPSLGVYVLHAWIFRENPLGMFFDWNPKVSCSAAA